METVHSKEETKRLRNELGNLRAKLGEKDALVRTSSIGIGISTHFMLTGFPFSGGVDGLLENNIWNNQNKLAKL